MIHTDICTVLLNKNGGGIEKIKTKKPKIKKGNEKELIDMNNSAVIVGGGAGMDLAKGMRVNGNGKTINNEKSEVSNE